MNKFELYCMIFYVLDASWDETKDDIVGEYLSGANPFLFTDVGSAEPSIFAHFCEVISENITVENSYSLAKKYVDSLDSVNITKAFTNITEEEWLDCIGDFLSQEHKGSNG